MTTSNHALTGALLAITFKEPALVLPLALLSHFVLDALPHFGINDAKIPPLRRLGRYIRFELFGILGIVALLLTGVYGFNLVLLASLVAISPDFEWLYRYIRYRIQGYEPPKSITARIHKRIQWCERPWGVYPEVIYFVAGYATLLAIT